MEQILVKTEFVDKTLPVVLVQLGGYIDQSNCDKLQKVFDNLALSGHFNVIFDLSSLVYVSSAGWGIFVGEVKRFRDNNGDIKLANMNSEIYEIFQMLEFYHIIEDFNSIEEALEAFGIVSEAKSEKEPEINIDDILEKVSQPVEQKESDSTFFEKGREIFDKARLDEKDGIQKHIEEKKPVEVSKPSQKTVYHKPQSVQNMEMMISQFPIQEKIRKIISQFPLISLRQMRKMLRHEDFGREKIGRFKFRRLLKEMDLETKEKRYRFYRSC
jgi:anti-sigma B factor antagonist